MPFVENQGAKLLWDEQGAGEPLLLIMGLIGLIPTALPVAAPHLRAIPQFRVYGSKRYWAPL